MLTLTLALTLFALTAPTALAHPRPKNQRAIIALIRATFPDDPDRALCIAARESTGTPGMFNPAADNGISYGLFQIHKHTWYWRINPRAIPVVGRLDWKRIYEPAYNARAARKIYLHAHGWGPWDTRGMCGA